MRWSIKQADSGRIWRHKTVSFDGYSGAVQPLFAVNAATGDRLETADSLGISNFSICSRKPQRVTFFFKHAVDQFLKYFLRSKTTMLRLAGTRFEKARQDPEGGASRHGGASVSRIALPIWWSRCHCRRATVNSSRLTCLLALA